jgi:hypothetical protein
MSERRELDIQYEIEYKIWEAVSHPPGQHGEKIHVIEFDPQTEVVVKREVIDECIQVMTKLESELTYAGKVIKEPLAKLKEVLK